MSFLNLFKHLLPNARAWRLTIDKTLRQFFSGLSGIGTDVKQFFDLAYLDIFPETTRQLDEWESEFAIDNSSLTEQERRDALAARWKAQGGQSTSYIQTTLRDAGYDVYVHEWWVAPPTVGVKSCATARNPITEGATPLVNKVYESKIDYTFRLGAPNSNLGGVDIRLGAYTASVGSFKTYVWPTDPLKYPYVFYIGGAVFGDSANVPSARQNDFEELILKIKPAQQWAGLFITYI